MSELELGLSAVVDCLIRMYDPCKMQGPGCLVNKVNPCCQSHTRFCRDGPCMHLTSEGCGMPNLECKIWFCNTAMKSMDPKCLESMKALENIAKLHGMISRPFLGGAYVGADRTP